MTGNFHANRKIKPSSYSSNISRSKSLGHPPIIPCWALITESMIYVTKVDWYSAHINTFFKHPAFSKRHRTFPMSIVLICAQIIILSASPAANAAFDYRPTALLLVNKLWPNRCLPDIEDPISKYKLIEECLLPPTVAYAYALCMF
jgi:hypothetical protein